VQYKGVLVVEKMKELIPRQMFDCGDSGAVVCKKSFLETTGLKHAFKKRYRQSVTGG